MNGQTGVDLLQMGHRMSRPERLAIVVAVLLVAYVGFMYGVTLVACRTYGC